MDVCVIDMGLFSSVISSVAEHTHAGASASQGEATRTINLGDRWSVNNAVQRREGQREITTAN